ncbi:MAG: PAS domain S-box protein [Myxococcales bacterium]|nr:PAS domain S-box protein [Myxococcales bacterium]
MRVGTLSVGLTGLALLLALLGVAGWVFDVEALRTFLVGPSTMKPNTALALVLVLAAQLFAARGHRPVSIALSGLTVALGVGTLATILFDVAPGLDALWWRAPGLLRMSAGTATAVTLLGLATALPPRLAWRGPVQVVSAVVLGIGLVGLAGYSFGLASLGTSDFWSSMALHTAFAASLGAASLLVSTREGPLTRAFVGDGLTARLGRKLALAVLLVPWLVCQALLQAGGAATRDAAILLAEALVLSVGILVAGLAWFAAASAKNELDLGITLDSIGDAVLLTDARGRVQRLNPVAERLTGWTSAEAVHQPVERVFHIINELTRAVVEGPVTRVLREGVVVGLANHTLLVDRQGRERPIADSGAPIRGPDQQVQGVVLVFRDMTQQHAAHRQLEQANATLKAMMNALPLGVLAWRDGTIVWANAAATRMYGVDGPAALVGRAVLDFIPPEDEGLTTRRMEAIARGEVMPPRRARLKRADGELLIDAVPVPGSVEVDGAPASLGLLQPVSDREQLELRLARQASFAEAKTELSRCISDAAFDLSRILGETARLSALAPDEFSVVMLWTKDKSHLTGARAHHAHDPKLEALASRLSVPLEAGPLGQRVLRGEVVLVDAAQLKAQLRPGTAALIGADVPERIALLPLRCAGETLGVLALGRTTDRPFDDDELQFFRGISDRAGQAVRNAQLFDDVSTALEKLKATEAQLRQSQKLEGMGQLAGGIAHDFNNLLSVILSLSELQLSARSTEEDSRADLEDIRAAAQRAAELTRQLLAFSRKQVMQLRPVEVNEVVRSMEGLLRRLLGEDVVLELELGHGLSLVRADATLLSQVVMNLAVNARDAMPRGGRLTVRTSMGDPGAQPAELPEGRCVCLSVRDDGEGMTPEVMSRLFEPFFTTKPKGKGTGLGLSTSYGITLQSGGMMTVVSAPGQGSTFTVWLPELRGGPRLSTPVPVFGERRGNGVVLLVEDEAMVRDVAERVLKGSGYTVHVASSLKEGLAAFERLEHVDLVLTDVVMPGGSGRELADSLLERRPGLKVLFMSGYTDDAVVRHGVREGSVQLLQKPFTPDTLLAAVGAALA